MAIVELNPTRRMAGLSSDTKPSPDGHYGDTFYETDTGNTYLWTNAGWVQVHALPSADAPPLQAVATDVALDRVGAALEQLLLEVQRLTQVVATGFDLDVPDLEEVA